MNYNVCVVLFMAIIFHVHIPMLLDIITSCNIAIGYRETAGRWFS